MAQLNDMIFGSFHFTVKGIDVKFIADEITFVRKVKGVNVISCYSAMDKNGKNWLWYWTKNGSEFIYGDCVIHTKEYVQSVMKSAFQIEAKIDGQVSFKLNLTDERDHIHEVEV